MIHKGPIAEACFEMWMLREMHLQTGNLESEDTAAFSLPLPLIHRSTDMNRLFWDMRIPVMV